jgi:predicted secreted protein
MEPEEAILILEPGPGSRLNSPVRVAGIADPTFEQTLIVRIVLDDGAELTIQPLTIAADIGQRGPFEGDVDFTVSGERSALIQVYDQSARDGGIVHLASVGVILLSEGAEEIVSVDPHPEAIVIDQPEFGATVSGGVVHVEGVGLASFEGTLIIEVHDADGGVVGSQAIIVSAPDWGVPGPFSADVPYEVSEEGPGRIVVIDPLPVFDGLGHISSVEVTLAP